MDNLRKSMIEELMLTLKIPQGNFNFGTIADEINHVRNEDLREFYKLVVSADTYGNGMQAIIKAAESFKPTEDNQNEAEAKRLINYCRAVNDSVFEDSQKYKTQFSDLIQKLKLREMVSPMDYAVLSNVKPYCNAIELIANINCYENSSTQLKAFVSALAYKDNVMSIESVKTRKMVLRTVR